MKKKKVAILLPWLKMGGTNKIAINFMSDLIEYCDVTLILSQNVGELLPDIPKEVHLIIDNMQTFKNILVNDIKHFDIIHVIKDVIYYLRIKLGFDNIDNYKYIVDRHEFICDTLFDCAISYHGQSPERLLNLLYRIHSRKKVAWIHGEINFLDDKCRRLKKYYQKLDHIFFISELTKNSFKRIMDVDDEKSTIYYNPNDKQDVLKKSELPCDIDFSSDYINLLTVGRISPEKGQDMIPIITRKLLDKGYPVRWYIVGDGDMRNKVEELINEYGVKESVNLLGTKTNPYNYMKMCDIYVQPSYTEGYSATICEAGMLGKSIICTDNCGIKERIEPGKDALFVNASVDNLTEGIEYLIKNVDERKKLSENIVKIDFEEKEEIYKFLKFINAN